jgi:hypothetical protein
MELIPILSTIVLVMTIATCILAVAAYFLYKARERKARRQRDNGTAPAIVRAEEEPHVLVAPQTAMPAGALPMGQGAYGSDARYLNAPPQQSSEGYYGEQPGYGEQQSYAYQEPRGYQEAPRQQYQQPDYGSAPSSAPAGYDYDDRSAQPPEQRLQEERPPQGASMFYEYTNDGFIPVDGRQEEQRRAMLPPAPRRDDSAEAARHYADRQQEEASDAQARAYREQAQADQAKARAVQAQQQNRSDADRQQEDGFAWL